MTIIKLLFVILLASCGKIEQIQDNFIAMSGNNDLRQVDIRIGFAYRSTSSNGEDYIEFENTQFRVGRVNPSAQTGYQSLPRGQRVAVHFKGQFAKRSGVVTSNPSLVVDVVDLDAITLR
jgi:hypothetical protein